MKFTKNLNHFKDFNWYKPTDPTFFKGEMPECVKRIYQISIPKTSSYSVFDDPYWNDGPRRRDNGKKIQQWIRCTPHSWHVNFAYRFGPVGTTRKHKNYGSKPYHPVQKYTTKKDFIKVAILRNPFDMLCSYYFHNKEQEKGWASVNYIHQFRSFKEFIRGYCDEEFEWHQPLMKQFLFSQLFDEEGNCVPDILLKYEYLNDSIHVMNKTWGLHLIRKSKNVSALKKYKYDHYYDNELIELVSKKCCKELEIFKYNYENTLDDSYFIIPEKLNFKLTKATLL